MFNQKYEYYLDLIENQLKLYLSQKSEYYQQLINAMNYSVSAGGKRLRPILLLEFCSMCGGDIQKALPFACAIELIHSYSLIHDDLPCMDNDNFRRGKPSCHIAFSEDIALLAGDGLLTLAFEIMSNQDYEKEDAYLILQAINEVSKSCGYNGMIGGQVLDLESENKTISVETLSQMHKLKTGELIKVSCVVGCIVANACSDKIQKASLYGYELGLAFQVYDDILDVIGNQKEIGKPIGSDFDNNKNTYVTICGIENAKKISNELTDNSLKVLDFFENNEFLVELTKRLIKRKN